MYLEDKRREEKGFKLFFIFSLAVHICFIILITYSNLKLGERPSAKVAFFVDLKSTYVSNLPPLGKLTGDIKSKPKIVEEKSRNLHEKTKSSLKEKDEYDNVSTTIAKLKLRKKRKDKGETQEETKVSDSKQVSKEKSSLGTETGYITRAGGGSWVDVYATQLRALITKNWVLPGDLAKIKSLEVVVGMKLAKNGKLIDVWTAKKSGNKSFDAFALRAVIKASDYGFPPIPQAINDDTFFINFMPKDFQK